MDKYWIYHNFKENFFKFLKNIKVSNLLENLPNFSKVKTFKHFGNHITVNTLNELDEAKKNIKKFKI